MVLYREHGRKGFCRWMIQCVSTVLLDNWSLSVEREDLQSRAESIEQNSEEQNGASLEEGTCRLWHVVEDRAKNKSHGKVAEELREGEARVAGQPSEASPQAQLDLLRIAERVRRLDALTFRLLGLPTLDEFVVLIPFERELLLISLNILQQLFAVRTVLPSSRELIWRPRDLVLVAWFDNTLLRGSHGSQEVGRGLTIRALEAHVLEVSPSLVRATEEDLAAFIEDNSLQSDG